MQRTSTRWRLGVTTLGAALAGMLAVTAGSAGTGASDQRFAGTIKFGATMSLTGPLAAEAQTSKAGYDFMIKRINQKGGIPVGNKRYRVQLISYDDQSNPNLAVQLYEKLITGDKVHFLLGPYSSGVTNAVSTISEKYRIPMVVAHAATTSIYERNYKYLFGVLNTVDQYSEPLFRMAKTIKKQPPKRVAILYENALFPTAFADAADRLAKKYGFTVVYKESFPQGVDFSSLIRAAGEAKPDIVLAGGYTLGMISLVRQAAEQNQSFPMWMFSLGPTVPGFMSALKRNGEYLLEPIQWGPTFYPKQKDEIFGWNANQFSKVFRKEMGYIPDYHPPQSAAALEVYYKAISQARSLNRQKVRNAIAKIRLTSFYGKVCFDARGVEACKSMGVAQIQGGKPVVVWPDEFAQRKLIYPAPGF